MSVAPYASLDLANAVWTGYYSWELPDCYGALWTPNPAENPPGPNGWKLLIVLHGGGMRQSGPAYAAPGTADVANYFVNNFGVAVLAITYPQGTFEQPEIEHPDTVVWPEHLKPIAHAIQFIKLHASNAAVVGAGGKISTAEVDITGTGLSAGGYLHAATQLQEDGTFEYWPNGRSDDPWFGYQHNHCIGSVRVNGGQIIFSKLSKGVSGDFTWDNYGEFTWWGSYFYSSKWIASGGTWEDFLATGVPAKAEPIGMVVASNPRVFDVAWYLVAQADTVNHAAIKNLSDAGNSAGMLYPNHYTLGVIDTDLTSLHAEVHEFRMAYELKQLGHSHYRMKAGNSTTNPDDATAAVRNPDLSNSRFGNWRAAPTKVEVVTGVTYTGATVTVTFFKAHQYVAGGSPSQVTLQGIASSGTLAGLLNGNTFTVTAVPAADKIQFVLGSTPTGSYSSGGKGYILGAGSPEEDYYTFLVDATYGVGWTLL